jgi:anthranilate phosphoribosyltransferase
MTNHAVLDALAGRRASVGEAIDFLRALAAHGGRLDAPADRPRPVVLPVGEGTRVLPNLTPLVALLLARYGVPVLMHGMPSAGGAGPAGAPTGGAGGESGAGRVTSAAVLRELGILPAANLADAQARLDRRNIAYLSTGVVVPGVAQPGAAGQPVEDRLPLRVLAALIDPFGGDGYRVVSVARPEDLPWVREILAATGADALLLCGTEGEPFADPCRQPQLEHFVAGRASVCAEAETALVGARPALPAAVDAPTTAAWIARALAGEHPLPAPIVAQLACCLSGAHRQSAQTANS